MIDRTALKFDEAGVVALLSIAWLTHSVWFVAFVAVVMLLGVVWPRATIFRLIYFYMLRPLNLLTPRPVPDREAPHRFARALGGTMVTIAFVLLLTGSTTIGWILMMNVLVLASINLFLGFCAGCFVFYQLERLGLRSRSASED